MTAHKSEAIAALTGFDAATGTSEVRLMASEVRSMADETAAANPTAEKHFLRAADAMDKSASSLSAGDIADAGSWLSQATNEMETGLAAIAVSDYC